MIFFPECFAFLGGSQRAAIDAAQPLTGPLMQQYQQLAKCAPTVAPCRALGHGITSLQLQLQAQLTSSSRIGPAGWVCLVGWLCTCDAVPNNSVWH